MKTENMVLYGKEVEVEGNVVHGLTLEDIPREEVVGKLVVAEIEGDVVCVEPFPPLDTMVSVFLQYENACGTKHFTTYMDKEVYEKAKGGKIPYRQDFFVESYNAKTDAYLVNDGVHAQESEKRLEIPASAIQTWYNARLRVKVG
ncbi:hypothetical protein [Bacillus thuringiensis]|uniref:hypothetical protein n=1 Tax=Bacillus thuringiensis TaxID=1428 RepID=UPI000BFE72FD|nr:hypothetical protein [Bacillus thuringiensis]PGT89980.1 hypothetical protein COD17_09530 [Bacillus thuringiensis]